MTSAFETGNPESQILVLGQAPSSQEMRQGEPFVGPSGTIFNECLARAGLARRQCYITNVWEEPVVTDKRTGHISTTTGTVLWKGKFTQAGLDMAQGALQRIRQSGANVVLALGQQALELCTGKNKGIMKWRGSILEGSEDVRKLKILPTVHPAAILHGNYIWKYFLISDLRKAAGELAYPELRLPERDILIKPTFDQIMDAFAEVRKAGVVATDIEVINEQLSCFCLCTTPHSGVVVPLVDGFGDVWTLAEELNIMREYARIMGDREIMKVNQNIVGFDATFLLWRYNIMTRGPIGDTMIGYGILYPEFPKDLGFLGSIYTREPYWKDEGKMWKDISSATSGGDYDTFWRYNGKDGCVAMEIWPQIEAELKQMEMWDTYQWTVDLLEPVLFMTICGLKVDKEAIAQNVIKVNQEIQDAEIELAECAEKPFNPLSTKQCADYFYGVKGIKPYIGKSGGVTTDDKALSRIIRKVDGPGRKEAELVQTIRNRRKLRSTYLEVQFDPDGRLRCSWNVRGTWTGRFSSGQTIFGTGMNLQNVDPRFKSFIVEDRR